MIFFQQPTKNLHLPYSEDGKPFGLLDFEVVSVTHGLNADPRREVTGICPLSPSWQKCNGALQFKSQPLYRS